MQKFNMSKILWMEKIIIENNSFQVIGISVTSHRSRDENF